MKRVKEVQRRAAPQTASRSAMALICSDEVMGNAQRMKRIKYRPFRLVCIATIWKNFMRI